MKKDTSIIIGETIGLRAERTDVFLPVDWFDESGTLLCADCTKLNVSPDISQYYYARSVTDLGCIIQDSIYVKVDNGCGHAIIEAPNFLTPNGDGLNDVLRVEAQNVATMIEIKVFNRWGAAVFYTTDVMQNHWNGTSAQGETLSSGVYAYYIKYLCLDGTESLESGNITLLR